MLKKAILVFLSLLFLLFLARPIEANSEFPTDILIEYDINEQGKTLVKNTLTIENTSTEREATSFILNLEDIIPINPRASEGNRPLKLSSQKDGSSLKVQVDFDNPVLGIGKTRTFIIEYEDEGNFASKTGEVWEISIPRSSGETFRSYNVVVSIPESFGYEAYISPQPTKTEKVFGKRLYFFGVEAGKSGVAAGFGEFQVFNFTLNYHLENPVAKTADTEIALPPDTSLQRVYYQNIQPQPENVIVDEDGNWLAKYQLAPKERLEVTAQGVVQTFASPRQLLTPSEDLLSFYIRPTKYWETENPKILELAKRLKNPSEIYHYVTKTLAYDYERVRPNVIRLGAVASLEQPQSAICMEYTDLFIAIARAAGIPAREVNGYAYTENPKIQPLSLVADVLHSWPEYWDRKSQTWVSVDPTWGSTTGGVDYFTKLDLRHLTFIIHGKNDSQPYPPGSYKLGPNPQKDVFVTIGSLPKIRKGQIEISAAEAGFSLFSKKMAIKIKNTGVAALYNVSPQAFFGQQNVTTNQIPVLPPGGIYEISLTIPIGFLGLKTPSQVRIAAHVSELIVPINKTQLIISQLTLVFLSLIILTLLVSLMTGKIRPTR